MKLIFSEARSDYGHYIFPYVVWAFPEPGETPDLFFERGFLPSSINLDRFYLCRGVRVDLSRFSPSSENRRILRKGESFQASLVERSDYAYTVERRNFFRDFAEKRFGPNKMSIERLDGLMNSPVVTHLIAFNEAASGREAGTAMVYLCGKKMAYYYYAFYDLSYSPVSLGMFMMTWAVKYFAQAGCRYLYLGSCYSNAALYKFQFKGCEFFTGFDWSSNAPDLKFRISREQGEITEHLLENAEYQKLNGLGSPNEIAESSIFGASMLGNLCESAH